MSPRDLAQQILARKSQSTDYKQTSTGNSSQPQSTDPYCWAYEIISFFQVEKIFKKEKWAGKKIDSFFKNCKREFVK